MCGFHVCRSMVPKSDNSMLLLSVPGITTGSAVLLRCFDYWVLQSGFGNFPHWDCRITNGVVADLLAGFGLFLS